MANYCDNTLYIYGSKTQVSLIKSLIDTDMTVGDEDRNPIWGDSFMRYLAPLGERLRYDVWGTKWIDISHVTPVTDDVNPYTDETCSSLTVRFSSAWAPPVDAYAAARINHPELFLRSYYNESGMGFCGLWTTDNGDDFYDYSQGKEALKEIPEDIREKCDLDEWFEVLEEMEQDYV